MLTAALRASDTSPALDLIRLKADERVPAIKASHTLDALKHTIMEQPVTSMQSRHAWHPDDAKDNNHKSEMD